MRMTLENYLSLKGNTVIGLARKIGRSRETVRRWGIDDELTIVVDFNAVTGQIHCVDVGKVSRIEGLDVDELPRVRT